MPSIATYDGPEESTKDQVRFLITDTSAPFNLSDDEIDWLLDENNDDPYYAGYVAATMIASKTTLTSGGSKSVGDLSISGGETKSTDYWDRLAKVLRVQAMRRNQIPIPYVGGMRVGDKEANDQDSSLTDPSFRRGMHDNLGVSVGANPDSDLLR